MTPWNTPEAREAEDIDITPSACDLPGLPTTYCLVYFSSPAHHTEVFLESSRRITYYTWSRAGTQRAIQKT